MDYRNFNHVVKRFSGSFPRIRFINCSLDSSVIRDGAILEEHCDFVEKAVNYLKIPVIGAFPIKTNSKYKPCGEVVQNRGNFVENGGGYIKYLFFGSEMLTQDILFFENIPNFWKIQTWVYKYCELKEKLRQRV